MSVKKKEKIFYGWIIVFSGAVIYGVALGFYYNTLTVFVKPVCEAFGFKRAQFALYTTIVSMTAMCMLPVYGNILKRFPLKKVMTIAGIAVCLVPMACSFATNLNAFYVIALFAGLTNGGVSIMAVSQLINSWFVEKRGMAMGIAFSGSGISASIMVPIIARVIENYGWQWGYRALSLAGALLLLPTILLLVREKPEDMGLKPLGVELLNKDGTLNGSSRVKTGIEAKAAVKTPTFWFLLGGIFCISLTMIGMQQHTIPYLTDIGYSAAFASSIMSLMMLLMTGSKMMLGIIFDRFGPLLGSALATVSCFTAATLLLSASNPIVPWLYAVSLAIGYASGSVPSSFLTAHYFGDKDFTKIYAYISMGGSLGSAIAPSLSGQIFDMTGNYTYAWYLYIGASVLMGIFLFSAYFTSRKLPVHDAT